MRGCGNRGAGRRVSCSSGLDTASGTQPTGYSEVIAIITDKSEFVNTAVPWFSFQREIVDRAVLSLKDAGVPFLFELVKAGEAEVKPRFAQLANFEREHLEIPAGVERQLVVGEHIGAALRRREVRQDDARHLVEAEQMRGEYPAVAGDNAVLFVDQHRVGEAKFADRRGDLRDLLVAVRARVSGVGDQRRAPAPGSSPPLRVVRFVDFEPISR